MSAITDEQVEAAFRAWWNYVGTTRQALPSMLEAASLTARQEALSDAIKAVRLAPTVDANGYIAEKSKIIHAILALLEAKP